MVLDVHFNAKMLLFVGETTNFDLRYQLTQMNEREATFCVNQVRRRGVGKWDRKRRNWKQDLHHYHLSYILLS